MNEWTTLTDRKSLAATRIDLTSQKVISTFENISWVSVGLRERQGFKIGIQKQFKAWDNRVEVFCL